MNPAFERTTRRKRYFAVTKPKARCLVITPLGHKILRAVARGTYVFDKHGRAAGSKRRGKSMRKAR